MRYNVRKGQSQVAEQTADELDQTDVCSGI